MTIPHSDIAKILGSRTIKLSSSGQVIGCLHIDLKDGTVTFSPGDAEVKMDEDKIHIEELRMNKLTIIL